MLWSIAIVLAVATFITEREILWLIMLAGVIVWLYKAAPKMKTTNVIFLFPVLLQAVPSFKLKAWVLNEK